MLLYRSSEARAVQAPGLDGAAGEVLRRCGVGDGQPFVLGPDGAYDLNLNRFLRELDGWGVRSAHTVVAYARDLMLFARFLHERRGGRSLWRADQEDLRAYKRARRHTPGFEVSAATWNRFLAALDKWVEWALYERLLTERPFRMVERTVLTGRGLARVVVNAEREVDDETAPVRFLPYVDYLLWRDVGLRGLLPDGGPDRGWRGRHGRRNAAFADLLVCTGMRLGEASSLLLPEVPAADGRAMTGAVGGSDGVDDGRARRVAAVRADHGRGAAAPAPRRRRRRRGWPVVAVAGRERPAAVGLDVAGGVLPGQRALRPVWPAGAGSPPHFAPHVRGAHARLAAAPDGAGVAPRAGRDADEPAGQTAAGGRPVAQAAAAVGAPPPRDHLCLPGCSRRGAGDRAGRAP